MSIKLTKTIKGRKVELDIISLGGRAVVRRSNFRKLREQGITIADLEEAGFGVEKLKKVNL